LKLGALLGMLEVNQPIQPQGKPWGTLG